MKSEVELARVVSSLFEEPCYRKTHDSAASTELRLPSALDNGWRLVKEAPRVGHLSDRASSILLRYLREAPVQFKIQDPETLAARDSTGASMYKWKCDELGIRPVQAFLHNHLYSAEVRSTERSGCTGSPFY